MSKFRIPKILIIVTLSLFFILSFSFIYGCSETVPIEEEKEVFEEEAAEEVVEPEKELEEPKEEPEPEPEPEPELVEVEVITDVVNAGTCDTEGPARRVSVKDGYAYVTDVKGLRVIDITDKENPQIIGNIKTPGFAMGVFIKDDFAYIADYDNGLQIIDITDKGAPQIIGSIKTPGFAMGVFIEGGNAFIAESKESGNFSGLTIIDISNKENPQIISSCDTPGAWNVHVKDNYAYIVGAGLQIIDISDLENPYIVGSLDNTDHTSDIYVFNDRAYIIGGGLQIIDITDKKNPRQIGNYHASGRAICVYIEENYAYIAGGEIGFEVIDIRVEEQPEMIAHCETKGDSEDIYIEDGYAYITDYDGGLTIIELTKQTELLKQKLFRSPQKEEEGASIIVGGGDEGVWSPQNVGIYVVGGGGPIRENFYISWDITGINNSEIKYAEIILNGEIKTNDPLVTGQLFVSAVNWGERPITMDDFNLKGEIIALPDIPDFSIGGDELINALQKAVDEGRSRFQIMAYFEFPEDIEEYQGRLVYSKSDIEFSIENERK